MDGESLGKILIDNLEHLFGAHYALLWSLHFLTAFSVACRIVLPLYTPSHEEEGGGEGEGGGKKKKKEEEERRRGRGRRRRKKKKKKKKKKTEKKTRARSSPIQATNEPEKPSLTLIKTPRAEVACSRAGTGGGCLV